MKKIFVFIILCICLITLTGCTNQASEEDAEKIKNKMIKDKVIDKNDTFVDTCYAYVRSEFCIDGCGQREVIYYVYKDNNKYYAVNISYDSKDSELFTAKYKVEFNNANKLLDRKPQDPLPSNACKHGYDVYTIGETYKTLYYNKNKVFGFITKVK